MNDKLRQIAKEMLNRGLMPNDDDLPDEISKEGEEDIDAVICEMEAIIYDSEIKEQIAYETRSMISDFFRHNKIK